MDLASHVQVHLWPLSAATARDYEQYCHSECVDLRLQCGWPACIKAGESAMLAAPFIELLGPGWLLSKYTPFLITASCTGKVAAQAECGERHYSNER